MAMLMLKMAATYTVPPFLTDTFDEVSVWSKQISCGLLFYTPLN